MELNDAKLQALFSKSDVFCIFPWVHICCDINDLAYPCCFAKWGAPIGNWRHSPLKELWNSPVLRRLRLNMLAGRKSSVCQSCYTKEKLGLRSFRAMGKAGFSRHLPLVKSTLRDGRVENFRIFYLDPRFSNRCNFKCRTCNPMRSSSHELELKKIYGPAYHSKYACRPKVPESYWREIEPLLPDIEEIFFAGGEPLIMEEHYRLLDMLIKARRFNVRLVYNTNLSVLTHKGTDVTRIWDRFETVRIFASLDASGQRGEYIRKGQVWEQIVRNRKRLFTACPRVAFSLMPTISVFNVLHLPDFHREWIERGYIEPDNIFCHTLFGPSHYCIQILPQHMKDRVREKYQAYAENVLKPYGAQAREVTQDFKGIINFMMAQDLTRELPRFWASTRFLDHIRKENFSGTFPELAELLD